MTYSSDRDAKTSLHPLGSLAVVVASDVPLQEKMLMTLAQMPAGGGPRDSLEPQVIPV